MVSSSVFLYREVRPGHQVSQGNGYLGCVVPDRHWRKASDGAEDYKRRKEMTEQFSRTELLLGKGNMEKLQNSRVAVFGVGGVGGYVVEALTRSGIGAIDLIDNDTVSQSNLNRQIIATYDTIGKYKTEVMRDRIRSINPECREEVHNCFYLPETQLQFDFSKYDYVVDAIDTVTGKIALVMQAKEANTPIISSMGAGNKLNPAEFEVADIYQTAVCPLARVMRQELKKRGVKKLKVVYSKEKPLQPMREAQTTEETETTGKPVPGSVAFVPSVSGLIIASEVVKDLLVTANP